MASDTPMELDRLLEACARVGGGMLRFVRALLGRYNVELDDVAGTRHTLDTYELSKWFKVRGMVEGCGLDDLCASFGVERGQAHRAADDIAATVKCARHMMRHISRPERRHYVAPMMARVEFDCDFAEEQINALARDAERALAPIFEQLETSGVQTREIAQTIADEAQRRVLKALRIVPEVAS